MRRKDKEITGSSELEKIIEKAQVCRFALCSDEGPYIVPVNFGYRPGHLYFHSAPEGKKIDLLRKDPRVCFEVETDVELVPGLSPCKWTTRYRSVIGFGTAHFLDSPEAKRDALGIIFAHYSEGPFDIPESACEKLVIIRISIDSMTGKASG